MTATSAESKPTGNDIYIKSNGISVCYDDLGTGNIPIIFIHGFPFDKSMWRNQLAHMSRTHRVIAYDVRGFGKSELGAEEVTINLFADDLVKFMDALEIEAAIICGLSMGGYVALNAIHRYSKRFNALILCDTQCIADSEEAKEKRKKNIQVIEKEGLVQFADSFIPAVFSKDTLINNKEEVESIRKTILSTSPKSITATLKALAQRWETCSSLKEISVPVLILCGKEDVVTPVAQSDFMSKNISNSVFKIIASAGHMSNLEQPQQFNDQLLSFISNTVKSEENFPGLAGMQTP